MEWSLSKLIRIESGAVSVSITDLRTLLTHYGVGKADVEELLELGRLGRERSWWNTYRDVASHEYISFLGYEASASIIRNFEPLLVPGLLQTEEYAREILSVVEGDSQRKVDALVDLRMERQELLQSSDDPTTLHFILDEAVVCRHVGGAGVMRRQLQHLLDAAQRPNVTLRVMPFERGIYPRLRVPYVLFEFPEPADEDVLYLESPQGQMIIREGAQEEEQEGMTPVAYLGVFWQLEQSAHKEDAPRMIERALSRVARPDQEGGGPDRMPDTGPTLTPEG